MMLHPIKLIAYMVRYNLFHCIYNKTNYEIEINQCVYQKRFFECLEKYKNKRDF